MPAEELDVVRLVLEVHLLQHADGEFPDDVGQCAHVVIREEHVEPEEDAEGDVQVEGHQIFHPRPQHLDHHLAAVYARTMHLAQARGGHRIPLEVREVLVQRPPQLRLDHTNDVIRGIRGGLVLELADGRQIRLRHDVRPGAEELSELDEGGTEGRQCVREPLGPTFVTAMAATGRSAQNDPSFAVSQECKEVGSQPQNDR